MANTDQILRFGIGAPDRPRSGVYRVWAQHPARRKADVYIALRMMGEEMKVSLHAGRGHLAVSQALKTKLGLKSRFLMTWDRRPPVPRGFSPEFQVVLPSSELRRDGPPDEDMDDVFWVDPAPALGAVQVCLSFDAPIEGEEWPGQKYLGTRLLRRFDLGDGSTCWVVAMTTAEVPGEFRERLGRSAIALFAGVPSIEIGSAQPGDPEARVLIGAAHPAGGLYAWIEVDPRHTDRQGAA